MGLGLQPKSHYRVVPPMLDESIPELWGGKPEIHNRSASELSSGLQPRTVFRVVLPVRAGKFPKPAIFKPELFQLSSGARKEGDKCASSMLSMPYGWRKLSEGTLVELCFYSKPYEQPDRFSVR